jgi:hypothetical protein
MADKKTRWWVFVAGVALSVPLIAADQHQHSEITLQISGTEIALIITAMSTLLGVVGGIWVQLRGQTEARMSRLALSNKMDVAIKATDGLSVRLGEAKFKQGTAEGKAVGLEQGREEGK